MSGLRIWFMAARPRTLPAAIAPVLVGSAAAWTMHNFCYSESSGFAGYFGCFETEFDFRWGAFAAALIGSIFIQIGTNLANDYSDAKRGADTVDRLGPVRVTASGLAAPRSVLTATWLAFAVAVAAGTYLAFVAGWVILAIGAASILAGVLYTGGPRPYGYAGLGELFVFLFFGLVAVNGSYYVQVEELDWLPFGLSVSVGCLATAILVVNNIRDIDTDRRVGKNTLAVRLGRERTRELFQVLLVVAYLTLPLTLLLDPGREVVVEFMGTRVEVEDFIGWWPLLGYLSLPLAWRAADPVLHRTDGPSLNDALARTGLLLAAFSVAVSVGLLLAA
ncbi:MAG: 1,4-dihydroxy-2-naphthoate polyprenyltransferase [Solirubrobacterales bacterium]